MLVRAIILVLIVLFIKFVLPPLYNATKPIVWAFVMALIINPLVDKIDSRFKIHRRATTVIIVAIICIILAFIIFAIVQLLIDQAQQLAINIQRNWPKIVATINNIRDDSENISKYAPDFATDWLNSAIDTVLIWIETLRTNILSTSLSMTSTVISGAGGFVVKIITFIMALAFLLFDFPSMSKFFTSILTEKGRRNFEIVKVTIFSSVASYIKAQLILATTCFAFMSVMLGIHGQDYFLLIGLFLAIIDFIPIIGAIAIMIPWSLVLLLLGNTPKSTYILMVGIAFFVLRKVIEPKVMSRQSGVHPLLTLISMYIGFEMFGVWGAVFGPIIAVFVVTIYRSGIFDDWVLDIRDFIINLTEYLRRDDSRALKDRKKTEMLTAVEKKRKRKKENLQNLEDESI